MEQKRLEEKKAEEAELAKKFKASPAPAHIYLPLYDEIAEQQETKRRLNHDYREELLRWELCSVIPVNYHNCHKYLKICKLFE